jgi:hypothetical protein
MRSGIEERVDSLVYLASFFLDFFDSAFGKGFIRNILGGGTLLLLLKNLVSILLCFRLHCVK